MRVAAIQTTAGGDRAANLGAAEALVEEAAAAGAGLVVLPEYFSLSGTPEVLRAQAEPLHGPTVTWASSLAARLSIHLVAGSFPERARGADDRLSNTSCLIGPDGSLLAAYRKIHLFDVALRGIAFRESDTIAPGDEVCVVPLFTGGADETTTGVVVGLTLCYDVRFPELYRMLALAGATVVTVPAAFTDTTGPAHWELLLRARAVEDQVFVIGAGQVGELPPGMPHCHGHSMVVDPWGVVLAERSDPGPGVVVADLDFAGLDDVRARLPVLANRRPGAYRGLHGDDRGTRG
jgi:predicted amidohydrolase